MLAYVRSVERHYEAGFGGAGQQTATVTLDILESDGADIRDLTIVARSTKGETFMVHAPVIGASSLRVYGKPARAKKARKPRAKPAPSCPIFPLRAPRDASRWDFLEVDNDG